MGVALAAPTPAAGSHVDRSDAGSILLVDAHAQVGPETFEQLCADGYPTLHALTSRHARALARNHPIRAVLLGELDARRGALDLLAEIRHSGVEGGQSGATPWHEHLPVIVLDPHTEPLDLLRAFEAGADDFIAHPPPYLELRARLKALLRRAELGSGKRLLRIGALEIDTSAKLARTATASVALSRLEYELLIHLARDPGRVCSKNELLLAIWGRRSHAATRTVDSHASRLRRKLQAAGAPGLVVNVRAAGYRLT